MDVLCTCVEAGSWSVLLLGMIQFERPWLPLIGVLVVLLLVADPTVSAQTDCHSVKNGRVNRSDRDSRELAAMDILHQRITLDLTLGDIIRGNCLIIAVPRSEGVMSFTLDLEALTVDSVVQGNAQLAFVQIGLELEVTFQGSIGTVDTVEFTVYYGGDPVTDASGFGGFYTGNSLIYNLGVAFASIPHSYGRTWFPCLDNFTERNTYEFLIKTAGGKKAWCNGALVERIALGGDTVISNWRIDETMPSYLASVAASNFVEARDTFANVSGGQTPVALIAAATDTAGMKSSFIHLPNAFAHFEDLFGPYRWNKVGYVLTPNGAMEHATSIHYPRDIALGNLQYESTMAHELAHHWFGDLVTCDRVEEMYINEGFAEYMSYLFLEDIYGRDRYMSTVRNNHRDMVHRAHLLDEGWWALSEMPQAWTYGEHTYNKGADVLHTLRSYMGDEDFSAGLTSFLETYAFQPVNTLQLRDHLTQVSGMVLTDFFADWIEQPGWAAFEIDEQSILPVTGVWEVDLTIQQKLRGPAAFYNNVPVTVAVVGMQANEVHRDTFMLGGEFTDLQFQVPFEPAFVWLNDDDRISLAITGVTDTIVSTATLSSAIANMDLIPQVGDTTLIRMEQYWVAADAGTFAEPDMYMVSPDRYWRVTGDWTDPSRFEARFNFDSRNTDSGNLDNGLAALVPGFREDSLVVLHRSGPAAPWVLWSNEVNTLGSATNGNCRMNLDSLATGEYTFALRTGSVGIEGVDAVATQWSIVPNPAQEEVMVTLCGDLAPGELHVLDASGRIVSITKQTGHSTSILIRGTAAGTYSVYHVTRNGERNFVGSLVMEN